MPKRTTDDDLELLAELGVDTAPTNTGTRTPREERIIAGFEEIERFVEAHGRIPQHGEDRHIFERLYAVRLDRLRQLADCRELVKPLDSRGLLEPVDATSVRLDETLDDESLLAELGVEVTAENELTQLIHVRSRQDIKAAEDIAQRIPCQDFHEFKPLFEEVNRQLEKGQLQAHKYQANATINQGDLFILDGQRVLVANMGELFISDYGVPNCRMRVVYENGTESDLLLRSLQRALNKDKASRRIANSEVDFGPLFSHKEVDYELSTGYIYVLRSQSDDPFIAGNRSVIHKIGVTGGDVKRRIAIAKRDPTYLLADVEVVATYKLTNINRNKLESLLHKFFAPARLEVQLQDRFGIPVNPREWFLVPLTIIEEVIEKVKEGVICKFRYDPKSASLMRL